MDAKASPILFPQWKEKLAASRLPAGVQMAYREEILSLLHHGKVRRSPISGMLIKEYLAAPGRQDAKAAREARVWRRRRFIRMSCRSRAWACEIRST